MKGARPGFLEELRGRGLLYQRTAEQELDEHLAASRVGYCGFDPTADSLTIGNLIPIQMLVHWQRAGHRPLVVMGGGTGLIGDPSGRDRERPLLSRDEVEANVRSQRRIFERLLDFDAGRPAAAKLLNNADWLAKLGFLDVLRDVGKHFSVNAMIQREAVRERLHQRDQGISYTEFSYGLLQAYDFLHLHREHACTLQMAGSDQYGNIASGIELIRRSIGERGQAFGVTAPLVTRSDGKKFSKSEGTAIWLTAERTSPFAFYQYWLNVPDADAIAFLRFFTLLGLETIEDLATRQAAAPQERIAQRALAEDVTQRLHGQDECGRAREASEALFGGGDLRALDAATLAQLVAELPQSQHARDSLGGGGIPLLEVLPGTRLCASKREARELLGRGALRVNGEAAPASRLLTTADLLAGGAILLRRGKKEWHATLWA